MGEGPGTASGSHRHRRRKVKTRGCPAPWAQTAGVGGRAGRARRSGGAASSCGRTGSLGWAGRGGLHTGAGAETGRGSPSGPQGEDAEEADAICAALDKRVDERKLDGRSPSGLRGNFDWAHTVGVNLSLSRVADALKEAHCAIIIQWLFDSAPRCLCLRIGERRTYPSSGPVHPHPGELRPCR